MNRSTDTTGHGENELPFRVEEKYLFLVAVAAVTAAAASCLIFSFMVAIATIYTEMDQ